MLDPIGTVTPATPGVPMTPIPGRVGDDTPEITPMEDPPTEIPLGPIDTPETKSLIGGTGGPPWLGN